MAVCDINLIAERRAQKQRAVMMLRLSVYSLIALFIGVAVLYAWMVVATGLVRGRIAEVDAKLSDPALADAISRIQFLETSIASLSPRVELLEKVHDSEAAWIRILRDISACIPNNVWISQLTSHRVEKSQTLTLRGEAFTQRDIGEFMLALDKPGWSGVPALGFTQAKTTASGTPVVEFEVTVPLTHPIGSDLK